MRSDTRMFIKGFLAASTLFVIIFAWWGLRSSAVPDSAVHSPVTNAVQHGPHVIAAAPPAQVHPPIPAALTGAPPAEAWLPQMLTDQEKAKRAAADAFLFYSTKLDSAGPSDVFTLQTELVQGKYDLMQSQLDTALTRFLSDAHYETVVLHMVQFVGGSFGMPGSDKYLIDTWEKQRPNSSWAHHSAAWYWFKAAWQARGDGFLADVTGENLAKMHRYLSYARDEVHQAIRLEPRDVFAWLMLMNIDKTDGRFGDVERDYRSGSLLDPAGYHLPAEYEIALDPHWYGSYKKMDELAAELASKTDLNPRFWALQGASYESKACARCNGYDWVTGLTQYNRALRYGDSAELLSDAGEAAVRLGHYGLAAKYFERAAAYYGQGIEDLRNSTELQLMQALCDPKETTLAFRALRNDAQSFGGITVMDYPRRTGDCNYHEAELPWGDEPIPSTNAISGYFIDMGDVQQLRVPQPVKKRLE